MALKKLQHIEIEDDFKLIGIHCQLDGYKLAFNLNKFLKISLENFDYGCIIFGSIFIIAEKCASDSGKFSFLVSTLHKIAKKVFN